MMKEYSKPIIMLAASMLLAVLTQAQSTSPQSINSVAITMSQNIGSVSFTVGDLVVLTQTDEAGNSLGGGFTNSATNSTAALSVNEINKQMLKANVYPNPFSDILNVHVMPAALNDLQLVLTNIHGKTVYSRDYIVPANIISINTSGYAPGIYLLLLKDNDGRVLVTGKIIKQ